MFGGVQLGILCIDMFDQKLTHRFPIFSIAVRWFNFVFDKRSLVSSFRLFGNHWLCFVYLFFFFFWIRCAVAHCIYYFFFFVVYFCYLLYLFIFRQKLLFCMIIILCSHFQLSIAFDYSFLFVFSFSLIIYLGYFRICALPCGYSELFFFSNIFRF